MNDKNRKINWCKNSVQTKVNEMEEIIEFKNLIREDLIDEYLKLFEKLKTLQQSSEADKQTIHELSRNLKTANAAETYLAQELEQLTAEKLNEENFVKCKQKLQLEYDDLRKNHSNLLSEFSVLQTECESLKTKNQSLEDKLGAVNEQSEVPADNQAISLQMEREEHLQSENMELLAKIDEIQEDLIKYTLALADREKNIEILRDQVHCLEENLKSKKEELEEKTNILESAQEQIVEANCQIARLTSTPDNTNKKGNSLFAEVDDQRQVMKQLLAKNKKSYLEMKKIFNESQFEIRQLKRENAAMHTELQACSSIFCSADKVYKQKLNERIKQLLTQIENLEKKLSFSQDHMASLANGNNRVWLDSILSFCKQETEDLKKELHRALIENSLLAEQLRNSQQDMARWRFEALKSRCVLINREDLLTENNIKFKHFTSNDIQISESALKEATPRISVGISINDTIEHQNKSINEIEKVKTEKENLETVAKSEALLIPKKEPNEIFVVQDKENADPILPVSTKTEKDYFNDTKDDTTIVINDSNPREFDIFEDSPLKLSPSKTDENAKYRKPFNQRNFNHCAVKEENITDSFAIKLEPNLTNQIPDSILVVKRDIFENPTAKSVKFLADELPSSSEHKTISVKGFAKETRTKSNLIVRRVYLNAKSKEAN